ncbi:MAG: CDP-alcohol phosphatidyltransferase family protein [Pseudomonadota bacterium]
MISHRLGHRLDPWFKGLFSKLDSWRIRPDHLTVVGAISSLPAILLFGHGTSPWAGIALLASGFFDLLDGAFARMQGKVTAFGGFLDSVLDRYVDLGVLAGIAYRYGTIDDDALLVLTLITMVGTALVPYSRARAELIVPRCSIGIAERPERIIILAAGNILNVLPTAMLILAVITHVTTLQRINYAKRKSSKP